MEIQPVRDEEDYEHALREIAELMERGPEPGTEAFDRLDVLVTLVEAYESEEHAVDAADPVEVIRFHMDRLDLTQAELARRSGLQRSHLSAIMNGRRSLSLNQIKQLSVALDIPTDRLIDTGDVDLDPPA